MTSGGTTHKLKALLGHKTVLEHTLDAVRASGLRWHLEDAGHAGMGDSISAAVRATPSANGWLMVLGDLPMVQSSTLQSLAAALAGQDVVVPTYRGQRGHPVGFSARCRDALLNLKGDQGAAAVVRDFGATTLDLDDQGILLDIDTVADLEHLRELMGFPRSPI